MDISNLKVAALITNGFEEVEYTEPRKALEDAGATVHLVSPESGSIKAWDGDDWGGSYDVEVVLDNADPAAYDALLLPGGVLSPDSLRINEQALAFVRSFFRADKPVAVICHGSQTMINAKVIKGRSMTCYESIRYDVRNAGADYIDKEVVVDANLVSSRNPGDIPAFNKAMLEVFAGVPA
ncbi:type 1 glutamine amidotransferase [Neolewinella aurantiaca]|uniref:Type 1 glutamine amidotransferase n=1 Tax=Neolewinella aurantiaca TaxID=2602767 RepID=A0A5C7FK10_9BACT|nr:type 1 glutamine amidotransferase domain-containing protein [Neolewinella aurantiaca]TXF87677.1 type 1 glutamine amidotransferase [Neolewinella aurantiaca]